MPSKTTKQNIDFQMEREKSTYYTYLHIPTYWCTYFEMFQYSSSSNGVSSYIVLLALMWLNQNSFIKEAGPKLPSVIHLFDESAYQKALDHHVLDDTLCSPVLGLNVRGKQSI